MLKLNKNSPPKMTSSSYEVDRHTASTWAFGDVEHLLGQDGP